MTEKHPKNENATFNKNMSNVHDAISLILSILTLTGPLFCPPLAIVAGALFILFEAIHAYDKRNHYKLAHKMLDTLPTCKTTKEELITPKETVASLVKMTTPKPPGEKRELSTNSNALFATHSSSKRRKSYIAVDQVHVRLAM